MIHLRKFFLHPPGRATGVLFALCGFIFGTWASFIPYVKDKFQLDEAQLGMLLLCMPVGTIIANPLSVLLISRWGAVHTSLVSVMLMALAFALPVVMPNVLLVSIGLVLGGITFASLNVAMNTCASDLEQESGFQLMSACHGMWSLGAMGGALISGFAILSLKTISSIWLDVHLIYMSLLVFLTVITTWRIRKDLRQIHEDWSKNRQATALGIGLFKPNKILWILISIILCTYLTEGTMADWSAVYMREITHSPETIAGWGFAVYAFFMAAGRFMGDELIARYGNMPVLQIGGQLVIVGLTVIILSVSPWMALPGFMLTGLGISVASPILYAAAARVPGMAPGAGLATMNSFGMAAFLGGPVIIGFVAKAINLRVAFMFVLFTAAIWVWQTRAAGRNKIFKA